MAQGTNLGIRMPLKTKAALSRAAKADSRSTSSLVLKVLTEWVVREGWLEGQDDAAHALKKEAKADAE